VKDFFLIVITASDIAESIQGEKRQCDVRKILDKKKLWWFPFPISYPFPNFQEMQEAGGVLQKCVKYVTEP